MPIFIDPVTGQRIVHAKHTGDIVYDLVSQTGSNVATLEHVPVIGGWVDYTGSGGPNSRSQQMFGGTENELFGTRADIEGRAKKHELDEKGMRKTTTRTRIIKRYRRL